MRWTIEASQIVTHPVGCPSRAFCGCGDAVRVFGRPIKELWRAANWFRFPRAAPAPGMVAVRRPSRLCAGASLGRQYVVSLRCQQRRPRYPNSRAFDCWVCDRQSARWLKLPE